MRREISAIFDGKKVELIQTESAMTPYGGLSVWLEFIRRVGFAEKVRAAIPFERQPLLEILMLKQFSTSPKIDIGQAIPP